jgi:hypothetical protein
LSAGCRAQGAGPDSRSTCRQFFRALARNVRPGDDDVITIVCRSPTILLGQRQRFKILKHNKKPTYLVFLQTKIVLKSSSLLHRKFCVCHRDLMYIFGNFNQFSEKGDLKNQVLQFFDIFI